METNWIKKNDFDLYKDEFKHSKTISSKNFIHDFEKINPLSVKYISYWKEIKRRCIEGYWFEGKWMPGNLYYYVNVSKILLNKANSKTKSLGRPKLRDLEWEKGYVFAEARGFSGFKEDKNYTCKLEVLKINQEKDLIKKKELFDDYLLYGFLTENCFKSETKTIDNLKSYVSSRFYLRLVHAYNLGKPLFENNASNVMDIEARRLGKSWWASNGLACHNFLFDGATDYDVFLNALRIKESLSSETLIGAIEAKYSNDLCSKIIEGLNSFKTTDNGIPHPFYKQTKGSLDPSDFLEASYTEKENDTSWVVKGSKSKIHNRTFQNKPSAGNGTGSNLILLEEVGFMSNLVESLSQLKDATYDGTLKFGTVYAFGTSGEMESGKSNDAKTVFYNPEQFDCLVFNNVWEDFSSVGFFVPYIYRLDKFSDEEGNVNKERALREAEEKRDKLKKGRNEKAISKEFQNNPLCPSEAFLTSDNNFFPTTELRLHLSNVKMKNINGEWLPENGELVYDVDDKENVELKWHPDLANKMKPCWYNMKQTDDKTGCVQIYEHPVIDEHGKIPHGVYLAGNDPYDQDNAVTSDSLGSTFVYKKFYNGLGVSHEIVAEYTARPDKAKDHHETVRRLLLYYNAMMLYENEKITIKVHFEQKNSLYLLTKKPTILKSAEESKIDRQYGIHMSSAIKKDCESMLNDWLREEREDGKLNLHSIKSVPLLEELINYNATGNFDRVISFMLTIVNVNQNYNVNPDKGNKKMFDNFIFKLLNKGLFND